MAAFEPPAYRRPVMDEAGLMGETEAQNLSIRLEELYRSGGSQVAVLTVKSLNGVPIESASIQTVDKWKLGTEKKDNGVLLLVSKGDRAVRIEVGQGLEGALSDLYSKRIVEDVIIPRFKGGDFETGIIEGVVTILKYTDPDYKFLDSRGLPPSHRTTSLERGGLAALLIWLLLKHPVIFIFLLIFFLSFFRGGRRRMFRGGYGGFGGGGFGGGGFGGGGFGGFGGGGGGGFSGGGASGRW